MFERLIFDSDAVAVVTVVFISKFRCLCTSSVQREIGQRNVQKSVIKFLIIFPRGLVAQAFPHSCILWLALFGSGCKLRASPFGNS